MGGDSSTGKTQDTGMPSLDEVSTAFGGWEKTPTPETTKAFQDSFKTFTGKHGEWLKAEEKRRADEAASRGVPDEYKLDLPKDSHLDPTFLEDLKKNGKEQKLTQADIERLLQHSDATAKHVVDRYLAAHQAEVEGWKKALEVHPRMGGASLAKTNELTTQILKEFGPPGFLEKLQKSGLAYNTDLVEFIFNIAEKANAKPAPKGGQGGDTGLVIDPANMTDEQLEKIFPS
jgi:hypothetical protein